MNDNLNVSKYTPVISAYMQPDNIGNHMADEPSDGSDWNKHNQVPTNIVKQEPMDPEYRSQSPNNDSGISPGHGSNGSTSAGQQSPSRAPLSSPEQKISTDISTFLHTQMAVWGYDPHRISQDQISASLESPILYRNPLVTSPSNGNKTPPPSMGTGLNAAHSDGNTSSSSSSCSSPDSVHTPLRSLQMTVESVDEATEMANRGNGSRNIFTCPKCKFNTVSRTEYNDHIRMHAPDLKCNNCDFVTKNIIEIQNHSQEIHNTSPLPGDYGLTEEEIAISVPKVNSQGKVKTIRCKHCEYICNTKKDFWDHYVHFITDLKHHMQYHLLNHFEDRPHKCPKCSYRCVNKSMLNSHLKSHSHVYQYRCLDCSYATKYCHSLKMHLRRNKHKPAMVLNPDGTPNPEPVIDVYGTRRGPKQRSKTVSTLNTTPTITHTKLTNNIPPSSHPCMPKFIPTNHVDIPFSYVYNHILPNAFPGNPISPNIPAFPQNANHFAENRNDTPLPLTGIPVENTLNGLYYHMNNNNNNNIFNKESLKEKPDHVINENNEDLNKIPNGKPLDLRKIEGTSEEQKNSVYNLDPSPGKMPSMQKTAVKNRRKGPPYKLEHISRKLQQRIADGDLYNLANSNGNLYEEATNTTVNNRNVNRNSVSSTEEGNDVEALTKITNTTNVNGSSVSSTEEGNDAEDLTKITREERRNVQETEGAERKGYSCQYCGITFIDATLYTIHIGYHGFENPFRCNFCGTQTEDKIAFNIHLARVQHT
ncbi:hypothetical protein L9F63_018066 [Diploptera punctata]|uniref:Protein hunchback n=1 Tax=Diploptera punctata TaxID=6984 RepID=A0AAD7ZYM3_DIPPU|nr:hypothetical protein L9F63_018066 [Diploptera punctata]